jgi:hypothetical protein
MGLVFEHLGRRCEAGQLAAAWATTLHTFQRTILHTHRSKFTQYLLWYLCEKARPLCRFTFQSFYLLRFLFAASHLGCCLLHLGVSLESPSSHAVALARLLF